MTSLRIQELDEKTRKEHYRLDENDICFYLGEYTARQGFGHSDINSLIYNLKKSPSLRHTNPNAYQWKLRAINEISNQLRSITSPEALSSLTIVPIPPSKTKSHPEYDDRIEVICSKLVYGVPESDVKHLIINNVDIEATHNENTKPSPDQLMEYYSVDTNNGYHPRETVILVDDMLTTGSHFKACKQLILQAYPEVSVVGLFVARRVFANPFADFEFDLNGLNLNT